MTIMNFSTTNGYTAVVKPVQKKGGRFEGKWIIQIRKSVCSVARSGPGPIVQTAYSEPNRNAAKSRLGVTLGIPVSSIQEVGSNGTSTNNGGGSAAPSSPAARPVATPVSPEEEKSRPAVLAPAPSPSSLQSSWNEPRPDDSYEDSPNNLATCGHCRSKIHHGQRRVGLHTANHRYKRWDKRYYHHACCSQELLACLNLPAAASLKRKAMAISNIDPNSILQAQLHQQEKEANKRQRTIDSRQALVRTLKAWRLKLARQRHVDAYMIFLNKTIDDIAEKLPRNDLELLKCNGIGPTKCRQYGPSVLLCVREFQLEQARQEDDEDNDALVEVAVTLKPEQVIANKFKEAEASGQVINI
jgi:hypothetical protein